MRFFHVAAYVRGAGRSFVLTRRLDGLVVHSSFIVSAWLCPSRLIVRLGLAEGSFYGVIGSFRYDFQVATFGGSAWRKLAYHDRRREGVR